MKPKLIKGTPFHVVTNEQGETIVVLGNQAVLKCKSKDEAINKIKTRDYELLINTMFIVKNFNHENYENKTNGNA